MDEDTKVVPAATVPTPSKPKKAYQYWGVFKDSGAEATPKAAKGYVEASAQLLSDPNGKVGQEVCILRAPKGSDAGEETGVCYVNGVRQVRRRKK